jgi:hypothetical protein
LTLAAAALDQLADLMLLLVMELAALALVGCQDSNCLERSDQLLQLTLLLLRARLRASYCCCLRC